MVVTALPATDHSGVSQDITLWPSISTMQAPHWPRPQPNFAPFNTVPNNISLDEVNPPAHTLQDSLQRRHAEASAKLNFREIDRCPEGLLNRILWHAQMGTKAKYPSWAIHEVDDDDD